MSSERTSFQDWKVIGTDSWISWYAHLKWPPVFIKWVVTGVAAMQRWNKSRHSPLVPLEHEMSIRTFLSTRMNEEAVDSYGADSPELAID